MSEQTVEIVRLGYERSGRATQPQTSCRTITVAIAAKQ